MNRDPLFRAYRYCEWITAHHYENFPVGSWLLPRPMRPHVAAIYAFARAADDFADEEKYRGRSLELLEQWKAALWDCARPSTGSGRAGNDSVHAEHPIFIALSDTLQQYHLSFQWFDDLLTAFRMDVTKRRYADWEELMTYCRYSAHPVGRLVLALFGIQDPELQRLSDGICSGLQLANHWQDLRIDVAHDIVYIPKTLMEEYGVTEPELKKYVIATASVSEAGSNLVFKNEIASSVPSGPPRNDGFLDPRFRKLMAELVSRARALFDEGEPLVRHLKGGLRLEIKLTLAGGRAILDRIEAANYDVFRRRPSLSTLDKAHLLMKAVLNTK